MSEPTNTPAAPVEPTTTASIIESAIADHPDRGGDDGGDDSVAASAGSDVATGAVPADTSTTSTTETVADVDDLAKELGLPAVPPGTKRINKIPYDRVQKIVENAKKKLQTEHETAIRQHTERLTAAERELQAVNAVAEMMQGDPEQFLSAMAELNPAYARYVGGGGSTTPRGGNNGRPEADVRLEDGRYTYSPEQAAALAEWQAQQVERRIAGRIAPFEQERQERQIFEAAVPRVKAQIAAFQKKPLFNENKAEIEKALAADPNISLQDAYDLVVLPKLTADRNRIYQELLAEQNARPHSTSIANTASRQSEAPTGDSRDIIRRSIAGYRDRGE
jgi:hypothetical protein